MKVKIKSTGEIQEVFFAMGKTLYINHDLTRCFYLNEVEILGCSPEDEISFEDRLNDCAKLIAKETDLDRIPSTLDDDSLGYVKSLAQYSKSKFESILLEITRKYIDAVNAKLSDKP